jgi:hypothetical protein
VSDWWTHLGVVAAPEIRASASSANYCSPGSSEFRSKTKSLFSLPRTTGDRVPPDVDAHDVLGERDIPVLGNVDVGHDAPNVPMPLGVAPRWTPMP